jgi:hypothetical protein
MKIKLCALFLCFGFVAGCSQNKLSDRDVKRQQRIATLEIKRQELSRVAGRYPGTLTKRDDYTQDVRLTLEIKDVPEVQEGEVDPVLVPRLIGTLRFLLGQEHEYIDAPITSSDFNATNSILSLVAKHEQFGDLVMQLTLRDRTLSGDWNAPSLGANGTIDLVKE